MNLAACTGDAAQSLCSSHGVVGRLRREVSTLIGEDSARRVKRSLQKLRPLAACM